MDLITAFATDDGKKFIERHFGDANYYDIYLISETNTEFIKRLDNSIDIDETTHADPEKAKGITGLLKKENVQVVVSKVFGPNIKRIKNNFVCVIMSEKNIPESILHIQKRFASFVNEWNKGEERKFFKF